MTRNIALLMVVVLVIGGVSAFPMAVAAETGSTVTAAVGQPPFAQVNENASDTAGNATAGERLAGVVAVGQAELNGEIDQRAYGIEFASAATDNAKADVVAERLDRIQQRLDELEERKQELKEARENGEISEGQYRAEMAELAVETETMKQMAEASEARANSLPADLLEEKGINVTAIQELKMNAEELSGGEVAEIARSIAGDKVGQSVSQGPPEDVGASARPGEAGDRDAGQGDDTTPTDTGDGDGEDAQSEDRTPTDTGDGGAGGSGQGG